MTWTCLAARSSSHYYCLYQSLTWLITAQASHDQTAITSKGNAVHACDSRDTNITACNADVDTAGDAQLGEQRPGGMHGGRSLYHGVEWDEGQQRWVAEFWDGTAFRCRPAASAASLLDLRHAAF